MNRLLTLLNDPKPESRSLWSKLSPRLRGLIRIVVALCGFTALALIHHELRTKFGQHLLTSPFSKTALKLALIPFGFGSTYLFIWGAGAFLTGRNWNSIEPRKRLIAVIVTAPVIVATVFPIIFMPEFVISSFSNNEWVKMRDPIYVQIKENLFLILQTKTECDGNPDYRKCRCTSWNRVESSIAAIEKIVATHPDYTDFRVTIPESNGHAVYDLKFLERTKSLKPLDCGD